MHEQGVFKFAMLLEPPGIASAMFFLTHIGRLIVPSVAAETVCPRLIYIARRAMAIEPSLELKTTLSAIFPAAFFVISLFLERRQPRALATHGAEWGPGGTSQ
jgi:hypothetical protein